jgi:beta-galactosidase
VEGEHGWLKSYSVGGVEQLAAPLRPNFWRAPTDNDLGWTKNIKQGGGLWTDWKEAALNGQLGSLEGSSVPEGAQIQAEMKFPLGLESAEGQLTAAGRMIYVLKGDNSLQIKMSLDLGGDAKISEIPRVGVQFAIPEKNKNIHWFGRGPQETYRDRKTGAAVGLYQSTVSDWITHYVRPQENSNRTDVHWIEFLDEKGKGLELHDTGTPFAITAWPYTQEDLESTSHDYLLPRRESITVNVDGFQIGIGGDTSWGLPVHDQYRLKDKGKYEFSFELVPASP